MELAFGTGLAPAWREGESEVSLNSKKVSSKNLARVGDGGVIFLRPRLSLDTYQRRLGLAVPKLSSDTPAVVRIFSQNFFDRSSGKCAATLFPMEKRLKREIRETIDRAIFHGGVGIKEVARHARRLLDQLRIEFVGTKFMTSTCRPHRLPPLLRKELRATNRRDNEREREDQAGRWKRALELERG
jgi:hypothetical protein